MQKKRDEKWQVADPVEYSLLKEYAKVNRRTMTDAESVFWSIARANGLGQKCRRQYIIGKYIVDFFFRESMLIVEIDGGYHFTEQQQTDDAERQQYFEAKGYRVLRFTNEEVIADTDQVISTIKNNL
jgi:very-short-patch-repair endonuclease